MDQRLHRRQEQRRAEAADDRPEHDDRNQVLRESHRQRTDGIGQKPQHVRALAADEVSDLAADQDERGGHESLQGDRRLYAARRRVEIVNDRGDRHVHERRIDDEDEHRHRKENGETAAAGRRLLCRRCRDTRQRRSTAAILDGAPPRLITSSG